MQLSLDRDFSLPLFPASSFLLPAPGASDHPCSASASHPTFPQEESAGFEGGTHEMQNPTLILTGKMPIPLTTGRFQLEPLDSVFPQRV